MTYRVVNTGNVALGGTQTVTVTGPFGEKVLAVKPPQVPLLIPGGSFPVAVTVAGVSPRVWLTARVAISPLVLPGTSVPVAGPFTASTQFLAIPWLMVVLLLLLLVLAIVWWFRRRRARAPTPRGGEPADATAQGPRPAVGSHRARHSARTALRPPREEPAT